MHTILILVALLAVVFLVLHFTKPELVTSIFAAVKSVTSSVVGLLGKLKK